MASAATTKPKTDTKPATGNAAPTTGAVARTAPVLTSVRTDIPMPVRSSTRGSKSFYMFDSLAVGASFGVIGKTQANLTSIISNQNRKTYPKFDAENKPVFKPMTDAAGAIVGYTTEQETFSKKFISANVDPNTDPDKASVRVWREK